METANLDLHRPSDYNFIAPDFSDPLQAVFFGLIFFLLLAAVIILYKTKDRWRQILNHGIPGESNSFDAVKKLLTSSRTDNFLLSAPSVFLMIGLLGTFINLGVALNHLGDALSHNKAGDIKAVTDDINDVLRSLGTKFKTSIWGILANLVFRFMLFKTYGDVLKGLVNDFLTAQNHITLKNQKLKAELEKAEKLKEQKDRQEEQRRLVESIITAGEQGYGLLNKTLDKLVSLFEAFDKNTLDLVTGGKMMVAAAGDMREVITAVSISLTETTDRFAGETDKFIGAVGKFENKTGEVLDSVKDSIDGFNQTVVTSFENFESGVKSTLEGISKTLEDSTNSLQQSVGEGIGTMTTEVGKMTEITEQMTNVNAALVNQLAQIKKILEKTNDQFLKMTDLNAYMEGGIKAVFKSDGKMETLFARLTQSLNEIKDKQVFPPELMVTLANMETLFGEIKATMGRLNEKQVIPPELTAVLKNVDGTLTHMKGMLSNLNQGPAENTGDDNLKTND
jgi:hypothetical protein